MSNDIGTRTTAFSILVVTFPTLLSIFVPLIACTLPITLDFRVRNYRHILLDFHTKTNERGGGYARCDTLPIVFPAGVLQYYDTSEQLQRYRSTANLRYTSSGLSEFLLGSERPFVMFGHV